MSKSWFLYIRDVLDRSNSPSVYGLIASSHYPPPIPHTRREWKAIKLFEIEL